MVKQPAMEASEFTMSNEDFPALPGVPGPGPNSVQAPTVPNPLGLDDLGLGSGLPPPGPQLPPHPQPNLVGISGAPNVAPIGTPLSTPAGEMMLQSSQQGQSGSITGNGSNEVLQQAGGQLSAQQQQAVVLGGPSSLAGTPVQPQAGSQGGGDSVPRRGIQTSPSGLVTNIPTSMVRDQFGMIGLLTFIRAAETDPNLVSLALGADLTTLGLNLNSEVNLYPTFGGPWAETPCRPQDIDYHVPYEYLTNTTIR